jgi:2,3-bisphosphoglycerate-dependent phosphoglycerate mutase
MATRIKNKISKLILVRHGQSTYNEENRFTGWKDVGLTDKGIIEAENAAILLKDLSIDLAFTSDLKRAQNTLKIILDSLNLNIDITYDKRLNERDYGDLIGQNKKEAALKFGEEQVQLWRRSYNTPPPGGESLKMTYDRCVPYFKDKILSELKGNIVLVSAHGNSIRAIVKYLFNISNNDILKTEIGWCEPWVFTFDENIILSNFEILFTESSSSSLPENIMKSV